MRLIHPRICEGISSLAPSIIHKAHQYISTKWPILGSCVYPKIQAEVLLCVQM